MTNRVGHIQKEGGDKLPVGIDAQAFAEIADFWLARRHPHLDRHARRLKDYERQTIIKWLRLYGEPGWIMRGIAESFELGKPVRSINFCQPQVDAVFQQYKETRVGGGPR